MQKLKKTFIKLYKNHKVFKLISLSSRLFTSEQNLIHEQIDQIIFKKNIKGNKNDSEHQYKKSIMLNNLESIVKKYTSVSKNGVNTSFASLLRNSNLIQLGNPEGKIVIGKIFQVVKNDLYIDFGWKFYCVCLKPIKNNSKYIRGATVRLQIKNLELSTRFLGSNSDTNILEADCTLLGLVYSPYITQTDVFTTVN